MRWRLRRKSAGRKATSERSARASRRRTSTSTKPDLRFPVGRPARYASIVGSILVVQSDPDTRDRLGSALRDAGHEVIVAFAVRAAVLRLREGGIDVVLVDAYDPRVGVTELSRHMESLPDTPPLVLISGSPHAPEISARIGAAAFIPKPYDANEMVV